MYEVRLGSYYRLSKGYTNMMTIYATASDDYCATELTFTTKANEVGTLEMTIPPQNVEYTNIEASGTNDWYGLGSYIEVIQDQDYANPVWNGIVNSITKDMFNQLRISAMDMMYVLQFQKLPTRDFINETYANLFQWVVDWNNWDAGKKDAHDNIDPSIDYEINKNYKISINHSYTTETFPELQTEGMTSFDAISAICDETKFFSPIYQSFGSDPCVVIRVDDEATAYFQSQTIELGANMLDYTNLLTTDGWYTSIAPIGEDSDGNYYNISSVTADHSGYIGIDSDITDKYGERRGIVIFPNITDPNELMGYGMHYLITHSLPDMTITVSAFDLSQLDMSITQFTVGQKTRVYLTPFDVEVVSIVTGKSFDVMNPESTQIELSNVVIPSLTQKLNQFYKERRR